MKLNKVIVIPAPALTAGLSLAAGGSGGSGGSSGSGSWYSQGMTWEASQEHAGNVVDFGGLSTGYGQSSTGYQALGNWCSANVPSSADVDFSFGGADGYVKLHPNDLPGAPILGPTDR